MESAADNGIVGELPLGASGIGAIVGTDDTGSGGVDSPATIAGIAIEQPATAKRRGRPPGSGKPGSNGTTAGKTAGKSASQKASPASVTGIEKLLFSIHAMAAAMIAPELAINDDEAKLLAGALADVGMHYGDNIDPRAVAWVGLIGTVGQIYGTRFFAWKIRKANESKRAPENLPGQNWGAV